MKTRIIYTDIWDDNWFQGLSDDAQKLFFFLITNNKIGMTGMYQLPDIIVTAYTRITGKKLTEAKLRLFPKVLFIDGWVKVVNASRYNPYKGGKNDSAYDKELLSIPDSVKVYSIKEKEIVYPQLADTPINQKSEIINQKSETFGESENLLTQVEPEKGGTYPSLESLGEVEFSKLAETFEVPEAFVRSKFDDLETYCGQNGKSYKNYYLALRGWVKRDALKIKQDGKNVTANANKYAVTKIVEKG